MVNVVTIGHGRHVQRFLSTLNEKKAPAQKFRIYRQAINEDIKPVVIH